MVREEAREQAAGAIDGVRVIGWDPRRLNRLANPAAGLLLGVVVLEVGGAQGLDQRQVEDAQVDRRLGPLVAVVARCRAV